MVTRTRALAPTMLLAAGTFAGSGQAAVVTESFNITPTSTLQKVALGGTDLYSYGLVGSTSSSFAQFASLGTAELSSCSASSAALNANPFGNIGVPINPFSTSSTFNPSATGTSYANLRFVLGGETLYGTATFQGATSGTVTNARLTQIRYGTLADAEIETPSAVPEPAIWAEMLGGLGAVGGAFRAARRRKAQALATA